MIELILWGFEIFRAYCLNQNYKVLPSFIFPIYLYFFGKITIKYLLRSYPKKCLTVLVKNSIPFYLTNWFILSFSKGIYLGHFTPQFYPIFMIWWSKPDTNWWDFIDITHTIAIFYWHLLLFYQLSNEVTFHKILFVHLSF